MFESQTTETPGIHPAFSALPESITFARAAVSTVVLAGLAGYGFVLNAQGEDKIALSLVFGALFGIVLQRARFCFFCNFRDWYDSRDPRGLYAILIALASGLAGYTVVFGGWLPDAFSGRLPPTAFIGPVSIVLVLAGLVFGAGMALSGSCVSAHLYRLGEGSPTAPFALLGTVAGFILGFLTWNSLYLSAVSSAPMIWIPGWLGYAGALVIGLLALALVGLALRRSAQVPASSSRHGLAHALLIARWPAWAGGLAVGAIGTAAYLRVAPLGVTAEISGHSRDLANALGWLPVRLEGLDTLRGCVSIVREALLTPNGAFIIALVIASFAAALTAGQFKPEWPTRSQILRGFSGGILLGWGAMTGLGCTVGTLLSGIMAGALSGWVFGVAVFTGAAITLTLGRRPGVLTRLN